MRGELAVAVEQALAAARVGRTLVIGFSAGVDSVTLAHLLLALRDRRHLVLHLAHFDHALRPASPDDARFAKALSTAWGLPFHSARWAHGNAFPGGVEAAARNARYAFLTEIARGVTPAGDEPCIVVAHHADDQAETLLLHLMRGSGLHGLAGMRVLSHRQAGKTNREAVAVFRPLLRTSRSEIVAYAEAHNLAWCEDASNDDVAHTRNFVRHHVLPLLAQANPAIAETLARTSALLAQEAERLDALDARALARATVAALHDERLLLRYSALHEAPQAERCAILRLALEQCFALREVSQAHIRRLAAAVDGPARASGPHPLVEGVAWSVLRDGEGDLLSIHRAGVLPIQPDFPWLDAAWRAQPGVQTLAVPGELAATEGWRLSVEACRRPSPPAAAPLDTWQLWLAPLPGSAVQLTTPRPGMRMAPLGMHGHTRALGDIFTDRKVAPALRAGWPVITDRDGRVLWLCGLVAADGVIAPPGAPALHVRWLQQRGGAKP